MNIKTLFFAVSLFLTSSLAFSQTVIIDASSAGEIIARQIFPDTATVIRKPGAGGKIAMREMLETNGTIALVSTTTFITTPLQEQFQYDVDVLAVVVVASPVLISGKHTNFDKRELKQKVTIGAVGYNSVSTLTARNASRGGEATIVPYKTSGQLLTDVASGIIDYAVVGMTPKDFPNINTLHVFDGDDDVQLTFVLLVKKGTKTLDISGVEQKIKATPAEWYNSRSLTPKWLTGDEATRYINQQQELIAPLVQQ